MVPPAISLEAAACADKDRAVEWRLVTPPPFPVPIIGMVVQPELAGPHDPGANVGEVVLGILIVHARGVFAAGALSMCSRNVLVTT